MKQNILNLTKQLITIKSFSGNKKELQKILNVALSNINELTVEQFEKNGITSALVYNTKKRPKRFKILLNAHLDILPGKDYQYTPMVDGNRLYSAGAMDMKASAACIILAFKEVANKISYPLALQLVTDEESGGFYGTKYQIEKGVRADFIIAGESTDLNIVHMAKGVLWLKILCKGRSAHSAYPWMGKNALLEMNKFLKKLEEKYPTPTSKKWISTVSLSRLTTTNKTFNKTPDVSEAWLDIRYIPEDKDKILKDIKILLPSNFRLRIVENEAALDTDKNNIYIKRLKKITKQFTNEMPILYGAPGTSDARHFNFVNCPAIEFGPIGRGIGSDKEWISVSSLEKYRQILEAFLLSFEKN